MRTKNICARHGHKHFGRVGRQCSGDSPDASRMAGLGQLMLLAIGIYFCSSPALWAQTSDSQKQADPNSWTPTTETQSGKIKPTHTIESHTQTATPALANQPTQRHVPP